MTAGLADSNSSLLLGMGRGVTKSHLRADCLYTGMHICNGITDGALSIICNTNPNRKPKIVKLVTGKHFTHQNVD